MSDTVAIALIVGATGLGSAFVSARWGGLRTVEHEAMREHAAWGRQLRYEASVELMDVARTAGTRTFELRLQMSAMTESDRLQTYTDITTRIAIAVAKLTALGPPLMTRKAVALGDAAVSATTAALRGTKEEHTAAERVVDVVLAEFAGITQAVLGPPIESRSRGEVRRDRKAVKAELERTPPA